MVDIAMVCPHMWCETYGTERHCGDLAGISGLGICTGLLGMNGPLFDLGKWLE